MGNRFCRSAAGEIPNLWWRKRSDNRSVFLCGWSCDWWEASAAWLANHSMKTMRCCWVKQSNNEAQVHVHLQNKKQLLVDPRDAGHNAEDEDSGPQPHMGGFDEDAQCYWWAGKEEGSKTCCPLNTRENRHIQIYTYKYTQIHTHIHHICI